MICHPKLINSTSEILSLCEESGSSLIVSVPTEVQNTLNEMCDTPLPMQMAVHVSKTAAADIIEKVKKAVADIEDGIKSSEELSEDDKAEALELLSEINKKIEGKKKGAVIKAALTGLKDFIINTGAALTAAMIQAKIQGLF